MKIENTAFEGCFFVYHSVYKDGRGQFFEAFNQKKFKELCGLDISFVQDNVSISKKGVLRGLHFQKSPHEQAKLISVLRGEVLDVVVDLRKESKTYGRHIKTTIKEDDKKSLFIPRGMAHGFLTLSEEVLFHYKCDSFYNRNAESGIPYNDPDLAIDWEYPHEKMILSEKDSNQLAFKSLKL